MATDGRAIVQQFLDKLGHENDVDGLLELITPDVAVYTPFSPEGLPTRFNGRDEVDARFGDARRPMPYFTFLDVEILATEDPDRWVATCRSEGRQADGRNYANIYCWIFRLRDGKIAAWTEYYDPQKVMPFLDSITTD
ncbi:MULTISPECIES: nuclear transport factor 2 family protein [Sphingobium]|uniref:nuclear transport factor 2 family protein n=1 Tax=Sphingobium sp. MI1205 TaxID=407020 RepID=UPI00077028B8|nr:nuclear transport factor 2 family protein [Sphingobium sp. MI1205]AMK19936.1 hypothetical protein K663_17876 [Sphingobium sp. MI1205]